MSYSMMIKYNQSEILNLAVFYSTILKSSCFWIKFDFTTSIFILSLCTSYDEIMLNLSHKFFLLFGRWM